MCVSVESAILEPECGGTSECGGCGKGSGQSERGLEVLSSGKSRGLESSSLVTQTPYTVRGYLSVIDSWPCQNVFQGCWDSWFS